MQPFFQTILIPVDFSLNAEVAIRKALGMVATDMPHIHLLHVCKKFMPGFSNGRGKSDREVEAEIRLKNYRETINDMMPLAIVHCKVVCAYSVQQVIIEQAIHIQADLIVISHQRQYGALSFFRKVVPTLVSKRSMLPVLSVKPGSLHQDIRNVVMPVNEQMPIHKLEALKVLCRKSKIRVFLLSFVNGDQVPVAFSASALIQTFQWLKTCLQCPVEYAVVHGQNKVKAIVQFAADKQADVLLLNPDAETGFGWPKKYISDLIPDDSKMQVLTVHQV